MKNDLIKWNRNKEIQLKIAINQFNKKISEFEKIDRENKKFLPKMFNFNEERNRIKSENELNRFIKNIKKFRNYEFESINETTKITTWENKILKQDIKNYRKRLLEEYKELKKPLKGEKYSPVQMGHSRPREIRNAFKGLRGYKEKTGYKFNEFIKRMHKQGSVDYITKRNYIYKQNYMNALTRYSNFDGYKELIHVLQKFSNPNDFYQFFKNRDNLNALDINHVSDKVLVQAQFYKWLEEDLGINLENKTYEILDNNDEIITLNIFDE